MEGVKLWPEDTPGLPGQMGREEWIESEACQMIAGERCAGVEG